MRTTVEVYDERTGNVVRKSRMDLETGAEANIISRRLARWLAKRKLVQQPPVGIPTLLSADGSPMKCWGAMEVPFRLRDDSGEVRETRQIFYIMRRGPGAPDLLLSRPGMGYEGILLDTTTDYSFRFEKIRHVRPEEMGEMAARGEPVYVATLSQLGTNGGEQESELQMFKVPEGATEIPNASEPMPTSSPRRTWRRTPRC